MKTLKSFALRSCILLCVLLGACSTTTDSSEAFRGQAPGQIFKDGEDALANGNWSEAIKHYEALDIQYPYGSNTETAQLHIIYAYYKNNDFISAEAAADRFIHYHPASPHVDYAYFMRGVSNYYQNMGIFERVFAIDYATRDLTQVKKSFNDFSELQSRFPASPYAPAAHQYMIYLRNVLANHQLEVADYYYQRKAYIAAANRASLVVKHYQGAPVVPDALVMMAKCYHQLQLTAAENETINVIRYNYPDSTYLQKALSDSDVTFRPRVAPPKA